MTVLDAIIWITAATKSVNIKNFPKCFLKTRGQIILVTAQIENLDSELVKLVLTINLTNVQEYSAIDECLQTQDLLLNDVDIINCSSETLENEEHDGEEDMKDDTYVDKAKITAKQALQLVNQLKTFYLSTSDTVSITLVSQLQSNFENQIRIQKFLIFSHHCNIHN